MKLFIYQYKFRDISKDEPGIQIGEILPKIATQLDFKEWVFLVNENSIELIVVSDKQRDPQQVWDILVKNQIVAKANPTYINILINHKAASRFFQIATGVADAQEGETNLLEKLQAAYLKAVEKVHVGPFIHYLFQRGIWLHEKIRQDTRYFRFAVQIEYVFRELANKILGSLNQSTIYVNGYAPVAVKILDDLYSDGCRNLVFFENHEDPNTVLIERFSASLQPYQSFVESISPSEILLIFSPEKQESMYDSLCQKAKTKSKTPLLIFNYADIQLPQNEIKKISNCYSYGRNDIEYVVEYNQAQRQSTLKEINQWIQKEIDAFHVWLASEERYQFSGIIGAHPEMQRIFELVSRISRTDITVLIDGESGTGKELVAKAIHQLSARSDQRFVVVNCGAIPENLLESELFGHERGAFTGAVAQKKGLFEEANSGTIFLDEIAELPPQLQVKLLRVLQDGEIKPVGSNHTLKVNVRVLAATNKDVSYMVEQGLFRSDLFYRINVMRLTIPPLRKRSDDIRYLAHHFLKKFSQKQQKEVKEISSQAMDIIMKYHWPGNVRELENVMEHSVALTISKSISMYDLPLNLQNLNGKTEQGDAGKTTTLKEVEKNYILEILEATNWNYDVACEQLGIGRTTLWRKIKEYKMVKS